MHVQRRSHESSEVAKQELAALAIAFGVKPLSDDQLRSYTSCLAQHHSDDLRAAFAEIRRRGQGRSHAGMPHLFLVVQRIRDAYRARTVASKLHVLREGIA